MGTERLRFRKPRAAATAVGEGRWLVLLIRSFKSEALEMLHGKQLLCEKERQRSPSAGCHDSSPLNGASITGGTGLCAAWSEAGPAGRPGRGNMPRPELQLLGWREPRAPLRCRNFQVNLSLLYFKQPIPSAWATSYLQTISIWRGSFESCLFFTGVCL